MQLNEAMIDQNIAGVIKNVSMISSIVDSIVKSSTGELDKIMSEIKENIIKVESPSVEILEKYFLELSNCVYFISEESERFGLYDAISKMSYKEAYNTAYMNPDGLKKEKPTVAELTAYAEGKTISDSATNEIYLRVYKIIKTKLDMASTMISSLSKCISRRMSENSLSMAQKQDADTRKILNEQWGY